MVFVGITETGWSFASQAHDARRVGELDEGLGVYSYTRCGQRRLGISAEEIEAVFPRLVRMTGTQKSVNVSAVAEMLGRREA